MTTKIKLRRDTAANWTLSNPVLALGEPGLETDSRRVKYGDGVTAWNQLEYAAGGSGTDSNDFSTQFDDGVNDNTYRFKTITGKKEFTYETEGYKYLEVTLTTAQLADWEGNYNLTFTSTATPAIDNIWKNWNSYENEVNVYFKSDFDANNLNSLFNGFTNPSTGLYVVNLVSGPYGFSAGDKIVIRYWTEGTTYIGDNWDSYNTLLPDTTSEGPTNSVVISLDEYTSWIGDGTPGTARADLFNSDYFGKHFYTRRQERSS
jgi:hypothetical protein